MPVEYPIRAAANITGISLDTLRAWERRYNAVAPVKTARGRVYDDSAIQRLLLLKGAVSSGRAIGQVASLSDAELKELDRKVRSYSSQTSANSEPESGKAVIQPLLRAIETYDSSSANDELGRLALLLRSSELVHQVILPVMRVTGENWEKGVLEVAQEHLLSACVRNLLGGMVRLQRSNARAERILFTTPQGELHEFGILAAALLAAAQEFQVDYLGPNLPAREVLGAAAKSAPQAVVVGIMETNATPAVRDDIHELAAQLPAGIELWLGGSGACRAADGIVRDGLVMLEDLTCFERRLAQLKAASSVQMSRRKLT